MVYVNVNMFDKVAARNSFIILSKRRELLFGLKIIIESENHFYVKGER